MAKTLESRHVEYTTNMRKWEKWRLAYEGGDCFIDKYLVRLSKREIDEDYQDRKCLAYVPAFAAAAVDDVKNAIIQRINEVTRIGGPTSFQKAVTGWHGGVDYEGNTMNSFIGTDVILELLLQAKVGVLVDNFTLDQLGQTEADKGEKHPFVRLYKAENILHWAPTHPVDGFDVVLLQECVDVMDDEYGLPTKTGMQYRYMRRLPGGGVQVTIYDETYKTKSQTILDLNRIPFHVARTARSLMDRVADHQIALMNLESSDISFARKANYPLYYEYYDPASESPYMKPEGNKDGTSGANKASDRETTVGMTQGRRVPTGYSPPGFVNPNPETLLANMAKEKELKNDIRAIVNLNLTALNPRRQSKESKEEDSNGLEASLSYLAQTLETLERRIGEDWAAFEGKSTNPTITYPKTYSIKSDEQRLEEVLGLDKVSSKVPSDKFQREVRKLMAKTLLGGKLSYEEMQVVYKEVDEAKVLNSDPNVVLSAQKQALVSNVTASDALGFDGEKEVEQAKKDRAETIALAMEAQGGPEKMDGNRGVPEMNKGVPKDEKEGKAQRGAADNTNQASEKK